MINTSTELCDRIAEDLIWRRKELTDLKFMVESATNNLRSRALIRCAVALLYAHWEGFVKRCSAIYLEFVAAQRLPYKNLRENFVALSIRKKYIEMNASEKISSGNSLADFFCTQLDKRSNIPYKNSIDTKSNLSSKVFEDILDSIGLDKSKFAMRKNFIDSNLVNYRNHIAHGEVLDINMSEYSTIHDNVMSLIEAFRNEIENAAITGAYKRK